MEADIEKDLKWLTELCVGVVSHSECCAHVERIQDEIKSLRKWLVEANSYLRSCYQVVDRQGQGTNWEALKGQLTVLLEKQHVKIKEFGGYEYEPRSHQPLAP